MNAKHKARRGSGAIPLGQYLGVFGRGENLPPEKALLLAVLEDAIHWFLRCRPSHGGVGTQRFREAESWIQRRGYDWPFSFDNVCELLGMEPESLRRKLVEDTRSAKIATPPSEIATASVKHRYPPRPTSNGALVHLPPQGQ